jgi:ATP-dependent Clp protease ATP-binding subunit ClpC
MFERFTEKAIKVIMLAQEEACRLGHNFVGTEQILLGLIGEGTAIAARSLKSMGVNLKDARVEVEKIIGRGSGFVAVEIPFTPRAKRVLELSWDWARQFGHNYIGTEHLLLGLLTEGKQEGGGGIAHRVLENLRIPADQVEQRVLEILQYNQTISSSDLTKSKTEPVPSEEFHATIPGTVVHADAILSYVRYHGARLLADRDTWNRFIRLVYKGEIYEPSDQK